MAQVPFTMVDVNAVVMSPYQKRTQFDPAYIQSLATSIDTAGLLHPITVRPKEKGKYEMVCGECRLRAVKILEASKIAAFVRELKDNEAREIILIENLERKDLTPMEEAHSVDELLQSKMSLEEISSRLGKSKGHLLRRAGLCNLTPTWQAAQAGKGKGIAGSRGVHLWPIVCLEMIARLTPKLQDEFFENIWQDTVPTAAELTEDLGGYFLNLSGAGWPLDLKGLAGKRPACNKCDSCTSSRADLFDDVADPSDLKKARCLDSDCFNAKVKAFVIQQHAELKKKHPDLIVQRNVPNYDRSIWNKEPVAKGVVPMEATKVCKEGAKGALPSMIIEGPNAGTMQFVKKVVASTGSGSSRKALPGTPSTLKERKAALDKRRRKVFNNEIALILQKPEKNLVTTDKDIPRLLAAVQAFGANSQPQIQETAKVKTFKDLESVIKAKISVLDSLTITFQHGVVPIWKHAISCDHNANAAFAYQVAQFFGVDIKKLEKQISEQIPVPKSWANLNADGTKKVPEKAAA